MTTPTTLGRHPFTVSIIRRFASTMPGTIVTDAAISMAAGTQRDRWSSLMGTVTKALLREHQIAITRVRGIGYEHLADASVPALADRHIKHIRRVSKKAAAVLAYGIKNFDALPAPARIETNTRTAQLATLHHITSRSTGDAIRTVVEIQNSKIDIGDTLKLLAKP